MNLSTKEKALEQSINSIKEQYGDGAIMRLLDLPSPTEDVIPTGLSDLDAVFGIGGVPKGRIIEIHGSEGAGKTALALHIAKQVSAALYIDADHGLPPWLCGGLHLLTVDNLEAALEAVRVAAAGFDLIVIDSLPALPMQNDTVTELHGPSPAKLLSKALPILASELAASGCTLILVNQMRIRPGIMFGNPEKTTGGMALKFYASIRLDVRRVEVLKEKGKVLGQRVRVEAVKNKLAPPYRTAELCLWYDDRGLQCAPHEKQKTVVVGGVSGSSGAVKVGI